MITLTIPNDDHIALRAFGKALEEMALAHGAEPRKTVGELAYKLNIDTTEATAALERLRTTAEEFQPEIDTTAQQVESLAVSVEANGATYKTDLGSDNPQPAPVADSTGTPWDERIHSASKALNADGTWRLRRKPKDMDEEEWAAFVESVKGELSGNTVAKDVQDEIMLQKWDELEHHMAIDPAHDKGDETTTFTVEPPVTPPGDDFHTDAGVVTEQTVAGIPPLPVPPPTDDWKSAVTHPENGDLCSVCMKPQFSSPSGVTCENGHGGAPAYEKPVPPPVVVAPPVPEFDDGVPFPPSDTISPALERMADHTVWDFPRLMTFLTERHGKIDVTTVNTLLAQDGMSSVQELNAHPDKIGPFVARVKAHLGE